MDVKDFNKWDLQPRILTNEEIANPMKVIDEVFDYAHLPDLRNVLWEWLKTTVSGNYSKSLDYRDRESILYCYEKIQKLLEAAHLLLVAGKLEVSGIMEKMPVNPNTSNCNLYNLTPAEEIVPIVERLVALLTPDLVFELGKVQEIDSSSPIYFFLTVLPANENRTYLECQDLVETACSDKGTVKLLSIKTPELEKFLLEGHLLYSWLFKDQHLVYRTDGVKMMNVDTTNLPTMVSNALAEFNLVLAKAQAFFEGAEFFLTKSNYPLGVFMLQQAAEHTLRGFLFGVSGRRFVGHDVLALRRFALPFFKELINIMPIGPEKDTCPIYLLGKAYVQARYHSDFTMAVTEIMQLKEWIANLLVETKSVFEQRMGDILTAA